MKRNIALCMTAFVLCLTMAAGLKGAAEPVVNAQPAGLTNVQVENAYSIVGVIMHNNPRLVEQIMNESFLNGLVIYQSHESALQLAIDLSKFVRSHLADCYLKNSAGQRFAAMIDEIIKNLLKMANPAFIQSLFVHVPVCNPKVQEQAAHGDNEEEQLKNALIRQYMRVHPNIKDPKVAFERIREDQNRRWVAAVPQRAALPQQPVQVHHRLVPKPAESQPAQQLQVVAGVDSEQGIRPSMEDEHDIFPGDGERFALFAVYDGHGGNEVSNFLKVNLRQRILTNISQLINPSTEQITDAVRNAFTEIDKAITDKKAGSTAVVILIDKQERIIYCANLGDARAVLLSNNKDVPLSHDHKASIEAEADRIRDAGGIVFVGRIDGLLAVSRAFGDKQYKRTEKLAKAMSEPEIEVHRITKDDQFIILACDGVWDVMPNEKDATSVVANALKAHSGDVPVAARELVQRAISDPKQQDNVTAIVLALR